MYSCRIWALLHLYFAFRLFGMSSEAVTSHQTHGSILMYYPICSRSHHNVFSSLAEALARRGHHVTIITQKFDQDYELNQRDQVEQSFSNGNIHVISSKYDDSFVQQFIADALQNSTGNNAFLNFFNLFKMFKSISSTIESGHKAAMSHPEVKAILQSGKHHFDLVIVAALFNEVGYFIAHHLQAPILLVMTPNLPSLLTLSMGYFDNPSFVTPSLYTYRQDDMPSFVTRFPMFVFYSSYWLVKKVLLTDIQENVLKELDLIDEGDAIDLLAMEQNASFGMYVTHYMFDAVRPTLPNTIDIGFIHCKPSKPLPKDLSDWFEMSTQNVVYVSFGSVIPFEKLPSYIHNAFRCAFAHDKYRFLLKGPSFESNSSNIKTCNWFPQQDILGHPKTSLFITHGGLLSIHEAIFHKVPALIVPLFNDGLANGRRAERQGYGLIWNSTNDQSQDELCRNLIHTIDVMLDDDSNFSARITSLNRIIQDDINTPAEKAVFWSEYVMRHHGAVHLKSPSINVPFFYFFHIDIFLFLFTCFFVTLYVTCRVFHALVLFVLNKLKKKVSSAKRNEHSLKAD